MSEQKYFKVAEAAKRTGLSKEKVRELCHARGQRFAFRTSAKSNFYIDLKAFEQFLERRKTAWT